MIHGEMLPTSKSGIVFRDILLLCLLIPLTAALQQQSSHEYEPNHKVSDQLLAGLHAQKARVHPPHTPFKVHGDVRNKDIDQKRTFSHHDERALAIHSSARSVPADRLFPAPSPSTSGGLASRLPARSLQDWRVEDIVLLATVDGKMYARDRTTGAHKWLLEVDRPMVETVYHRHNKSVDQNGKVQEDPLWIVEPSQDGSIYVYAPGSGLGLQRLGYTVKQLAELAPYASEGQPAVAYTAEKRTTLYTIDAGTGHIMKKFSSAGSISNDGHDRCRRVSPLDTLDDEECEAIGTLTLGHTEYVIGIQDRDTGEQISTIRYFEWGPNNRDQDLRSKYTQTMDGKYVSTKHDGYIYGLDLGTQNSEIYESTQKPSYLVKLSAPVARVYDLVRPADDKSTDASLVVLPQPLIRSKRGHPSTYDADNENIFVNCTESGSWYALSERTYPAVTEGATLAKCYRDGFFTVPSLPLPQSHRDIFTGIHWLTSQGSQSAQPPISPPTYPGIEAPPIERDPPADTQTPEYTRDVNWQPFLLRLLLVIVLGGIGVRTFAQQLQGRRQVSKVNLQSSIPTPISKFLFGTPAKNTEQPTTTPRVRESEPAKETIFCHTDETGEEVADASTFPGMISIPTVEQLQEQDLEENEMNDASHSANILSQSEHLADVKKPKLHKRGKRGGRKAREKETELAEKAKTRQFEAPTRPPEVITVAASESLQLTGPLQINSLVIHTDRVIGQGSCGTSVFEGSFEGRDVAVKRMLSQYYELASQEVSFLQQSDDHPNVVRYFCQQRDDHFLYIAVELCQASLFDVWENEKARNEDRQQQLQSLKLSIQQDVPRALQQLAAGLYHLHNLRIIHRDIKPQNILVAYPKRGQTGGPRLVISDFGLGKNLPENVSTLIDPTGNAGTSGWKAPELITQPRDSESRHSQSNSFNGGSESNGGTMSGVKRAADIFSLGCLFFWVMTDGNHPFEDENGWQQLRELNIKRGHKNMDVLERWSDAYEPMQLISSMLSHAPEARPTALQVVNHPFFWPSQKRLAFLCDVSDHFEREPRGSPEDWYAGDSEQLHQLELRANEVIGLSHGHADFLAKLDRHFVDTLGKQRKYSGNRLLDLLRALRNKKNHYEDMPDDVKRRVGPLAGGYLHYWCNRFPRLLMACYETVHLVGIEGNDRFRGYFTS